MWVPVWHTCSLDSAGFEAASVPSVCGIYRWYWQVLNLVPLSAPCSSAGGHCTVGLVLAETIGRLGGGVDLGRCLEIWLSCLERQLPVWPGESVRTFFAWLVLKWPWSCHAPLTLGKVSGHSLPFPSSEWKDVLLPPSESLSLCFFVRCFREAPAFHFWWWIDLEDPLLIAQLQKRSGSAVYLPSSFKPGDALTKEKRKKKCPFIGL